MISKLKNQEFDRITHQRHIRATLGVINPPHQKVEKCECEPSFDDLLVVSNSKPIVPKSQGKTQLPSHLVTAQLKQEFSRAPDEKQKLPWGYGIVQPRNEWVETQPDRKRRPKTADERKRMYNFGRDPHDDHDHTHKHIESQTSILDHRKDVETSINQFKNKLRKLKARPDTTKASK